MKKGGQLKLRKFSFFVAHSWATKLSLAAIGLVFPVLVLGYKSLISLGGT
jgi:hypothetical protein